MGGGGGCGGRNTVISSYSISLSVIGHYKNIAPNYDKYTKVFARASADIMKTFMSLTSDDQIIDIGGGTALTSFMLHKDFGLTKPVVCVDPSKEMLEVAEKNGAITIQSTAEGFLATKPKFPLKVVCINGCIHHFEQPDYVFSQLASFMPNDGICIVTMFAQPVFPRPAEDKSIERIKDIYKTIDFEAKGLKCRMVDASTRGEIEKELWYAAIRNKVNSFLSTLSERELESIVKEWEEATESETVINFETTMITLIITKQRSQ